MGHIKPSQALPRDVQPQKAIHTPVGLSFMYATKAGKEFCLSNCTSQEIREAIDCLRQLTTKSWYEVRQTGGKGNNKSGLGFTEYEDYQLKHVTRPQELSKELRIAGVRASQKFRIFGAYYQHKFHILWFDREHKIVRSH